MSSTSQFEKLVYVGINLQDILYGVELSLYYRTMDALLNRPGKRTRSDIFLAIYSTVLLFMVTLWVFTQAIFCRRIWELGANLSVGTVSPVANIWYMNLATVSPLILQLMTNGLMLYRCWMIWEDRRVIIIPSIMWAGTLVLGVVANWTSTITGGIYFHGPNVKLGLAYYALSAFLTAILTFMICYRLMWHGKLMKESLGGEFASMYYTLAALVIESVLPCTLCSAAFLISLGLQSQAVTVLGYIHALLLCVSPQMLILRVAMKRSTNIKNDNMELKKKPSSNVRFSPHGQDTSVTVFDVPYARVSELGGNEDIV